MKFVITFLSLLPIVSTGQYLIEGKVDTSLQYIKASIDIIDEWNQFGSISDEMIIKSTPIDTNGNFKFEGNELSDKLGFYRVRYSTKENGFYINWASPNYVNFIFSNSDSIQIEDVFIISGNKNNKILQEETKLHYKFLQENLNLQNELHENLVLSKHQENSILKIKNSNNGLLNLFSLASSQIEIENAPKLYKKVHQELSVDSLRSQYANSIEKVIQMHEYNSIEQKSKYFLYGLIASLILNLIFFTQWLRRKQRPIQKNEHSMIDSLTKKELEIIKLINERKTNKEIASLLYISDATVKTHINNIYRKLNVKSRNEAIKVYKS